MPFIISVCLGGQICVWDIPTGYRLRVINRERFVASILNVFLMKLSTSIRFLRHGGVVWFGGWAINLKVGDSRFSPVMATSVPCFSRSVISSFYRHKINPENISTQVLVADFC